MMLQAENKKLLRRRVLALRRNMTQEQINRGSEAVTARILSSAIYEKASCVMAFASLPDEIQTETVLRDVLRKNKRLCLPYITDLKNGIMQAAAVSNLALLAPGRAGILSVPAAKAQFVPPEEIDLIIVPGVAFASDKYRLGMGGGFYDRFLPKAYNAVKAGVFFAVQKVEAVPADKYDFPLDIIFTETESLE